MFADCVKVTSKKKTRKRKVKCDQTSKKSLHRNCNKIELAILREIGGETTVKFIDVRKGNALETRFSSNSLPQERIKSNLDIKTRCLQWFLLQRSEAHNVIKKITLHSKHVWSVEQKRVCTYLGKKMM